MWKMQTHHHSFLLLLLCFLRANPISPLTAPDRFTRSHSPSLYLHPHHRPQEYFEVNYLPPSDQPPPSCSHQILRHSFANTINKPPFTTHFSPPSDCPPPWHSVFLELHVFCKGEQYDRIAGLWLGGVELLRTSTAEPTESGIVWRVRKDITRYSSLLVRSGLNFTMMLENIVNDVYTGVYRVKVTFLYYSSFTDHRLIPVVPGLNGKTRYLSERTRIKKNVGAEEVDAILSDPWDGNRSPADMIIPISDNSGYGFWFRLEGERNLHSKRIQIPNNTYRAVLELCVSFHGNDEFWYSNPPDSYLRLNNLTSGRGNGAYREVFLTIDGVMVGSEIPFPVIFTGGINPLFWEPYVAIGAFNLPSYDFEVTPFLGLLLDGKEHTFGIEVEKGISFWYVNANLHLWLDHYSKEVRAHHVINSFPELKIKHTSDFKGLDGSFEIEAGREIKSVGWVQSSAGKITTIISQNIKFKNSITFDSNGNDKVIKHLYKVKKKIEVLNDRGESLSRVKVKRKYPLHVIALTKPGPRENRYTLVTNVTHALEEKYSGLCYSLSVKNQQDSNGWMEVEDHSVVSGEANTKQNYEFIDILGCYSRQVAANNGRIVIDKSSTACSSN